MSSRVPTRLMSDEIGNRTAFSKYYLDIFVCRSRDLIIVEAVKKSAGRLDTTLSCGCIVTTYCISFSCFVRLSPSKWVRLLIESGTARCIGLIWSDTPKLSNVLDILYSDKRARSNGGWSKSRSRGIRPLLLVCTCGMEAANYVKKIWLSKDSKFHPNFNPKL